MRIDKVTLYSSGKTETDPKVSIVYSVTRGTTGADQVEYSSTDEPLRTLRTAMQALCGDVVTLIGWPEEDSADITIRSVGIKYVEKQRGIVIGGTKLLLDSRRPFNFNTPYLEQSKTGEDQKGMASKALMFKVDKIVAEAERYLKGERAQTDMFQLPAAPVDEAPQENLQSAPENKTQDKKPVGKARTSKLVDPKLKLVTGKKK